MTSLILIFVVGMTILMLQFDRGLHQLRNKATAADTDNARPGRNRSKGFSIHGLIREFHVARTQRLPQGKFTRRKV